MKAIKFIIGMFLSFWVAFVAQSMWMWFFVPLGLPPIGYIHAYGIYLTLQLPFHVYASVAISYVVEGDAKRSDKEKLSQYFVSVGLHALLLLVAFIVGFIAHWVM